MFENILGAVKEQAFEQLGNFGLDNNQVEQAAEVTGDSIFEGIKNEALGGNLDGVMDLLGGKGGDLSSNPIVGNISQLLSGNLMSQLGLGGEQANGIAGGILPSIFSSLAGRFTSTDEADAGFDLGSVMSMLGGANGGNGGMMDMLGKVAGNNLGGMLGNIFGKK